MKSEHSNPSVSPQREPGGQTPAWADTLTDNIIKTINPSTVLDAYCDGGYIVEKLRQHGVDAWGMGNSESTLQRIHPEVRQFCWLGSLVKPLPIRFDLVICRNVVGHLTHEEIERVIQNLCQCSDDILIIPKVADEDNLAPVDIREVDKWVNDFAQQHFIHDSEAGFLTSKAMRFRKVHKPLSTVITVYERRLQQSSAESRSRRELNISQRAELIDKELEIQEIESLIQTDTLTIEKLARDISEKENLIHNQNRIIVEKENVIQDILNSRSWRLMQQVHKIRHRLIPVNSQREQVIFLALHGFEILRRDGLVSFSKQVAFRTSQVMRRSLMKMRLKLRLAPGLSAKLSQVDPVETKSDVKPHQASVDIIVCVHNALEDVKRCLESVIRYTNLPYHLILVDDGSDPPTQAYLEEFSYLQDAKLLRNDQAAGYTRAANWGLRESRSDYAILLNSDTIVTPRWLDRMVACAASDERIGMVGPLSNTASWQSIPGMFNADGDWADNPLPTGMTPSSMSMLVAQHSASLYPRLPFLNGFCLMIKRELIQQIGYLDEDTFGSGYGEENDYCLRALQAGWLAAVADDTYIYHAQSRSYSHQRRLELVRRADKALASKYGSQVMSENAQRCRDDRVMNGIRARSQVMTRRRELREKGRQSWEGKRVLFILPIADPGGGGNVVIQESRAMRSMGVDVNVANLLIQRKSFEHWYPDFELPAIYVRESRLPPSLMHKYDAVVATVFHSVAWMDTGIHSRQNLVRGYYIQDFEPDFFPKDSALYRSAWDSYTRFPDLIRMTKTEWNQGVIEENIGVKCSLIGPSIDIDLFRPRPRTELDWPNRPLRIAAMIRPSTPRRQPELTMRVLKEITRKHRGALEVILFGCQAEDPDFYKLQTDFPWQNVGILNRRQLAYLLNEADIFVDFSAFQAMGLTAMEAMACGATVIVPQRGGASSFANHESNALVVDTSSPDACLSALDRLVRDEQLRGHLQQQAMLDICRIHPEQAAFNILNTLFPNQLKA